LKALSWIQDYLPKQQQHPILDQGDVTYLPDEGFFDYIFRRGALEFLIFSIGVGGSIDLVFWSGFS